MDKDHPLLALSLNNLATLYCEMGNHEQAWSLLYKVMNNMAAIEITHTFDEKWLNRMNEVSYTSSDHISQVLEALETIYEILDEDTNNISTNQQQLHIVELALGLLDQAKNQTANEKDKLRFLEKSNHWLQKSLMLLDQNKDVDKAFRFVDQNKSVLLLEATQSEAAYRLGELPDSLIQKDQKFLKRQSELQAQLLEKRLKTEKDSLRNMLNEVSLEMSTFIGKVKNDYPKYYQLKYTQKEIQIDAIQLLLDDETALIEYVITDSTLHIFIITNDNASWIPRTILAETLNEKIHDFHHILSDYVVVRKDQDKSWTDYVELAHWFYLNLLNPVLESRNNISNLIIIPDGDLGHLPFETFLIAEAKENNDYASLYYVLNDYNISYNYSATLWKENKEATPQSDNQEIFAVAANYDIKIDSGMTNTRLAKDQILRGILSPLPAARKEVENLAEHYNGHFIFDTLASERNVKEMIEDYSIIHFATHGLLNEKRPMLSSLVLTEDGDSVENNFWQAYEISKMELNADLVVLSACETGFGKFETGNGIASLARAFMYTGSPSLVVSLWQVNDNSTGSLIKYFYAGLAEDMNKDEALRKAKLSYIKNAKGLAAHPAYWSPFILMGDTKPVNIQQKGIGKGIIWGIVGGLSILVLGGAMVKRRKSRY